MSVDTQTRPQSSCEDRPTAMWATLQGMTFEYGITVLGVPVSTLTIHCDPYTPLDQRALVLSSVWSTPSLREEIQSWATRALDDPGHNVRVDWEVVRD